MSYALKTVDTTRHELELLSTLLKQVFQDDKFSVAYLNWLYAENPAGPVIGVNAWSGESLAGHYAVIPIWARRPDREVYRAALSLNTAVHGDHQRRGLFTQLAEETYRLARRAGVSEVVGVANASSTPGFVGQLGFRNLGPLEASILWRRPRFSSRPSSGSSWVRVWDRDSLAWRLRNPAGRYSVEMGDGRGAILAHTGYPGIRAVLRLQDAEEWSDLDASVDRVRYRGIRLWMGRSPDIERPALGGFSLPLRLRPSPLNLIFRPLEDDPEEPPRDRFHFEAIDFDAY
jgi:GNAT superfamily N-acetyltransferase